MKVYERIKVEVKICCTPQQENMAVLQARFASLCNPEVGFNFAGRPYGNDKFDAAFLNAQRLPYLEIFTGFIFHNPIEKQYKKSGFLRI